MVPIGEVVVDTGAAYTNPSATPLSPPYSAQRVLNSAVRICRLIVRVSATAMRWRLPVLSPVFGLRDQLDPTGTAWRWCHLVGRDPDTGIPTAYDIESLGAIQVVGPR